MWNTIKTKIGNAIGWALAWLILSSKNPGAVSLSVKAGLTLGLTWLTVIVGLGHIQLPTADLTAAIDAIVQFVQLGLGAISALLTAWGILRKVYLTLIGEHAGINSL